MRIAIPPIYHGRVKQRISELTSDALLALIRGGELDDFQIVEVLRSPYCTAQIAEIVATGRDHLGTQAVREKLAGFPGLSNVHAMNLLGSLTWSSLIVVAQSPKTPPLVRRQAERKLILQVPTMALGEKIAVARRAHRALFPALIAARDDKILTALLDNPRLVENDLVVLVNTGRPSVELLTSVVRHHRWSRSYRIRLAIVACATSPLPLALSVLVQLPRKDQRSISQRTDVSERVRSAAEALCMRDISPETARPGLPDDRSTSEILRRR